jgi:hypothetical protein
MTSFKEEAAGWTKMTWPRRGTKSPARPSRNQKRCFGQDEQDLQDKARTKPLSFCSFGILFILYILSISFRKCVILTDCSAAQQSRNQMELNRVRLRLGYGGQGFRGFRG